MPDFSYHFISDRSLSVQDWEQLADLVERAGVHYFHLREKDMTPESLLNVGLRIRPLLKRTRLIINGSLDVAIACGAEGVHLQENNLPVAAVRRAFPRLLIGYSAHSREELVQAEEQGADFAFLSPLFQPGSKSSTLPVLGIEQASFWIRGIRIPVVALGGIQPGHMGAIQHAGFCGIAGISFFLRNGMFDGGGMVH